MAKSEMIFICHQGSSLNASGPIGIIMDGHALPIAFKDTGDCEDVGFRACWGAQADIEDFFGNALRINRLNSPGLYHMCAVFDHEDDVDGESWEHLADQSCEHIGEVFICDLMMSLINDAGIGGHQTNKWCWA